MKLFTGRFRRVHAYIAVGYTVAFSALILWVMSRQSPGDWEHNRNFTVTLLSFTGPFTGAIARPTEASCLRFAFQLLPVCAAFLLGGALLQVIALPFQRGEKGFRLTAWVVGLFGWFGGAVPAMLFALS